MIYGSSGCFDSVFVLEAEKSQIPDWILGSEEGYLLEGSFKHRQYGSFEVFAIRFIGFSELNFLPFILLDRLITLLDFFDFISPFFFQCFSVLNKVINIFQVVKDIDLKYSRFSRCNFFA
jgi:hypothetical protein